MDWPLSREEKKQRLLTLYSQDVQAADDLLQAGDKRIEALRKELEAMQSSSGAQLWQTEVLRLRSAVESAAAMLKVMEAVPVKSDFEDDTNIPVARARARSMGNLHQPADRSVLPARLQGDDDDDNVKESGHHRGSPRRRSSLAEPEPEEVDEDILPSLPEILPELCAGADVDKLGLVFKKLPPDTMRVVRANDGSWAQKQGVHPSDKLVAVMGRRVELLSGPEFMELMKARPLRLLFERGGDA
eukprot:TRINITY_DN28005_c0_g1_i1.p1 TRINITY_DN28005_c0_g1~~TRINITY_DN28005_c0_g1_i1.p1  ORF type:complete len:244 (+),score=61.86 TRINITY_DN28005_c0_g1_i1:34-765(+)